MKNKFKVGDIIYTIRKEYWHDTYTLGCWHHIEKFEKFQIKGFYKHDYTNKVILLNIYKNYEVTMASHYLSEDFYTVAQYRKLKIKQLNVQNR